MGDTPSSVSKNTNRWLGIREIMFSSPTRLQSILSSAPVSVFTSETDHTTTICFSLSNELITSQFRETTRSNNVTNSVTSTVVSS